MPPGLTPTPGGFLLLKMIATNIRLPRPGQEVTFSTANNKYFGYYENGVFYALVNEKYIAIDGVLSWSGIHSE